MLASASAADGVGVPVGRGQGHRRPGALRSLRQELGDLAVGDRFVAARDGVDEASSFFPFFFKTGWTRHPFVVGVINKSGITSPKIVFPETIITNQTFSKSV